MRWETEKKAENSSTLLVEAKGAGTSQGRRWSPSSKSPLDVSFPQGHWHGMVAVPEPQG